MKRFMYASIGILALVAAFQLGAMTSQGPTPAFGTIVQNRAGIVAISEMPRRALDENGLTWNLDTWTGWERTPDDDPPVPISEIAFYGGITLITVSNELWTHPPDGYEWRCQGPWPGGPVPAAKTTWTKVKSAFRE